MINGVVATDVRKTETNVPTKLKIQATVSYEHVHIHVTIFAGPEFQKL